MSEAASGGEPVGCRILVTRPAHQSGPLLAAIRQRGGEPVAFPTIEIGPPADDGPWRSAAARLDGFRWLLFASVNAVDGFAERLRMAGRHWPAAPGYAAIGAKTAAALEARCGQPVLTPPDFRSESFLALPEMAAERIRGQAVLLVRGEGGRELLPATLAERGAEVVRLPVYARRAPQADPAPVRQALRAGTLEAAVFSSPETFTNLLDLLDADERRALAALPLVVISPVTARAVTGAGFPAPIVAPEASDEGLLQALSDHGCLAGPDTPIEEAR